MIYNLCFGFVIEKWKNVLLDLIYLNGHFVFNFFFFLIYSNLSSDTLI